MAESRVDYKTELIADRVWRTRSQLELATVGWVGWYNHDRSHEALGDYPPTEYEQLHAAVNAKHPAFSGNGSVTSTPASASERLTTPRHELAGVEIALEVAIASENGSVAHTLLAQAAPAGGQR
jgi:putative transposase